jgi:uncharacterized protein (TIGR01319 family)
VYALVDIGSTFTKVVAVTPSGEFVSRVVVPTTHKDLAAGADAAVARAIPSGGSAIEVLMCSSAGGGLRVAVIGLEPELTLEAGRRAAATAGARVVAAFAGTLDSGDADLLAEAAPDLVLLAGGTNGGDRVTIVENARRLPEAVPVVVAGNEDVSRQVVASLRGNGRIVRLVPNVLPRIGELEVNAAQGAIRDLFVEHVIGRGRFASVSPNANAILMPTPLAVLASTQTLARLPGNDPKFHAPVVIDVGGATTDVHSVQPVAQLGRTHAVVPESETTRTVEGDLGLRENAESLVDEAVRSGYAAREEKDALRVAATMRALDRTFLPSGGEEAAIDRRLATLAAGLALARHAGELQIRLTPDGATIRHTGRDLRAASCLVATGGIFEWTENAVEIIEAAVRAAKQQGALVPDEIPILIDRNHALPAAGLLTAGHSALATALLERAFTSGGFERVA